MTAVFRLSGSLDAEDPRFDVLWQRGCLGLQQDGEEVVAYFQHRVDLPIAGRWDVLPEIDYLEAYRHSLSPVRLGRLVIAPTHRRVVVCAGQRPLWLDPGRAFGTGHHETTRMALRALESLDLVGSRVLDIGSGSGILTIAADLLGASCAHGIDIDPVAVSVAEENAVMNASRATFEVGSLPLIGRTPPFDVVVGNLYAELHCNLMAHYPGVLAPGGKLLLTGILGEHSSFVIDTLPHELELLNARVDSQWVLLEIRRAMGA